MDGRAKSNCFLFSVQTLQANHCSHLVSRYYFPLADASNRSVGAKTTDRVSDRTPRPSPLYLHSEALSLSTWGTILHVTAPFRLSQLLYCGISKEVNIRNQDCIAVFKNESNERFGLVPSKHSCQCYLSVLNEASLQSSTSNAVIFMTAFATFTNALSTTICDRNVVFTS